ncbi:coiled-coil domain-containing protein [Nocardia goodfellowii]|uniref:Uncharacterized protein n=1 Tax=Nocardia goodfellowii TaxID=882446 RepID=A0ABS4Q9W8_9NOCA|nr:hypothetical protein [Nocardia goodfellowii]MBP2188489.1 hypothetical protein [Nocardia goodfellowii]
MQEQTREVRAAGLAASLEPIGLEIDRTAIELAESARPVREQEREQIREQVLELERDHDRSELELTREQRRLDYQVRAGHELERQHEIQALTREGLTPDHVEQLMARLDGQRADRDQETTRGLQRIGERIAVQRNAREMVVEIDSHNARVQETTAHHIAALEREATQERQRDPAQVQLREGHKSVPQLEKEIELTREAAQSLTLDRDRDKNLNAQVYKAFRDGQARFDPETGKWLARVEGREVRVAPESPERIAGEAARLAGKGWDPRAIHHTIGIHAPGAPAVGSRSPDKEIEGATVRGREAELARLREERERESRGKGS